jgi:hypothetical protein
MVSVKKILRYTIGIILILMGLVALLTPLTPGSWLIPIGLELLGLRILLRDKLLAWAQARPNSRFARIVCRLMHVRKRAPLRDRLVTWAQARPDSRCAGLIRRTVRASKRDPDAEKKRPEACKS